MPTTRKRYNKKRRFKKKKRNMLNKVVIRNALSPDKVMVKLRYPSFVNYNGQPTLDQVYRANSLFDPDLTGTGFQPNGFDEWSAFYNRYRVHACKIEAKIISTSATSPGNAGFISIVPTNEATLSGTLIEGVLGNAYCKWANYGPNVGTSTTQLSNYINIGNFMGKEGVPYDDVNQAAVTANPAREVFWHATVQSADQTSSVSNIRVMFILTYYTEFFSRKELARS